MLTKIFFLSGDEKLLITFSAGVAQMRPHESGAEAMKRADKAMYLAKRAGKNRVLGG
jgi:diguanylate cyclase